LLVVGFPPAPRGARLLLGDGEDAARPAVTHPADDARLPVAGHHAHVVRHVRAFLVAVQAVKVSYYVDAASSGTFDFH